jgi:nitrogen regulatory protein P-II 1
MKEIKAIIRPNKLSLLRNKLMETPGFPGMTISKAEGCSAPNKVNKSSIKDELTDYTQKIRIEIVCPDEVADALMEVIIYVCQTGQIGDGIVWMTTIDKASFIAKSK